MVRTPPPPNHTSSCDLDTAEKPVESASVSGYPPIRVEVETKKEEKGGCCGCCGMLISTAADERMSLNVVARDVQDGDAPLLCVLCKYSFQGYPGQG